MSKVVDAYKKQSNEFNGQFQFEYCDKVIEFFDEEPYLQVARKGAGGRMETALVPCKLPLMGRFATSIGVPSRKLKTWRSEHEDFDHACEIAQDLQEYIVVTNSLMGLYEKTFAKLIVKNKLGWTETAENDITSNVNIQGLLEKVADNNKESNFLSQRNLSII